MQENKKYQIKRKHGPMALGKFMMLPTINMRRLQENKEIKTLKLYTNDYSLG
jgi:hypothetical protein